MARGGTGLAHSLPRVLAAPSRFLPPSLTKALLGEALTLPAARGCPQQRAA